VVSSLVLRRFILGRVSVHIKGSSVWSMDHGVDVRCMIEKRDRDREGRGVCEEAEVEKESVLYHIKRS
jgi:hypothetical protein